MKMRPLASAWRAQPLARQILVWVLCILILTGAIGALMFSQLTRSNTDEQYKQRSLAVAAAVAQMPQIATDLGNGDPGHEIRALAQRVRDATGASYVVVTDRSGIRFSHPNPALIGKRLEEPVAALDGHTHVGIDKGSLGRSANGKAPIFDAQHNVIGQVSVGILEAQESTVNGQSVAAIIGYSLLVLAVGTIGSLILASRIKQVTFGLEPSSIAALLQEREAMLHGIREGVLGFDLNGAITVVNAEARSLLALKGPILGQSLERILPAGRLRDLLAGEVPARDSSILTDTALLVVNRMPVEVGGRPIGAVVTLRDRTEAEALLSQARELGGLGQALRAQEHEYANRIHIIAGLIELGEYDQAHGYLSQLSRNASSADDGLRARVSPPELVALLTAKRAVAAEQGIRLEVTEDSALESPHIDTQVMLTVVGNLIDNAVDAVEGIDGERVVTVSITQVDGIHIRVDDSGPGVPRDRVDSVLLDGYSTKQTEHGRRRGLGLALVSRIVHRSGGVIAVSPGPGGHFAVDFPAPPRPGFADFAESEATL